MQCPVCKTELKNDQDRSEGHLYECQRCGNYSLSDSLQSILEGELGKTDDAAIKLSYALYRMTKNEPWVMVDESRFRNILKHTDLPRPQEQFENLILWIGESQPSLGGEVDFNESSIPASGAMGLADVGFLLSQAVEAGLVRGLVDKDLGGSYSIHALQLTMGGWELFEELQRGKTSGSNAFMAMKFGDSELDSIFTDHFKPAVKATGFDLKKLDEGQPAGLIDDRLRVEIRQSRFLIADLTHNNNGAYWEAGYAEGLGKPVIYTCRKDVFEDKTKGTHFDTNHHLTVVWEPDKLKEATEKLKATIRATLPEEAKIGD